MLSDISFKNYKKSEDIHGTILYPAIMVAPVQKNIISDLMRREDIQSVFDPFHGSGTALYEAAQLAHEIQIVGCDINPLANLITKVKLQGVDQNIREDILQLKDMLSSHGKKYNYTFPNMYKWLREDIVASLSRIRDAIIEISNEQNRLFFWYMLCDIIRKYSNTRSSTYKLHIKEIEKIQSIDNDVVKSYISAIDNNADKFKHNTWNFTLHKCDILDLLPKLNAASFDLSITSPPYGDNATTVPYGQFSMLALHTIDKKDLELEGWEFENYSIIDSKSLGGKKRNANLSPYQMSLLEPFLSKIAPAKHRKVLVFFEDYFKFLDGLCRVTKKYIALTLGNRTVDRVSINLTDITKQYLETKKFQKLVHATREIPIKRTPKVTSLVYEKPVSSMNHEFIMIYEKERFVA
ncbi:hypothetical protein ACR4XJ_07090 [Nitratidesulfovibrio sp. D1]|uniref:hypothetical protein n=1 Tax=Nitratidesulfovibrio sp. D1 TaxID=3440151 RepID=UPI003EB8AEFA